MVISRSVRRRPDRIGLLDKPPASSAFLPSRASSRTHFPGANSNLVTLFACATFSGHVHIFAAQSFTRNFSGNTFLDYLLCIYLFLVCCTRISARCGKIHVDDFDSFANSSQDNPARMTNKFCR